MTFQDTHDFSVETPFALVDVITNARVWSSQLMQS